MLPGITEYTIVGFCPEVDWRPLSFLKPIPPHRVCSACGLVRKRSALLPCMHTLCESCYEQCVQEGSHVCPLDGYECQDEDDVEWKDFPADQLLRRQVRVRTGDEQSRWLILAAAGFKEYKKLGEVKCWNAESGCQHVAAASMISRHFQRECLNHSICCPKCSIGVLCGDVCLHLKSGSCGSSTNPSLESRRQPGIEDESASFITFRDVFEKQAGEIKGYLERITVDISIHGNRLDQFSHDMNMFKEALIEELVTAVKTAEGLKGPLRELSASNAEIKERLNARSDAATHLSAEVNRIEKGLKNDLKEVKTEGKNNGEKTLERITKVLTLAQLQTTRCEFFVPGVNSLEDQARTKAESYYCNEPVYLRGYFVSPGIVLRNKDGSVTVHVCIKLHKGDMDEVVLWPFEHKVRLSVVHPAEGAERVLEAKTVRSAGSYLKPKNASNPGVYIVNSSLVLAELRNDGFIQNDQLRVKWELLP